jgi:hypothetical protein
MLRGFLISIVILAVMCLGGFIVYNVAYARGEAAGYDEGYSSGQDVGYTSGTQEGYDEGYDEGYNAGKADGYDEGVAASLGHGYTLRDPTYQEAVSFIAQDRTDEKAYIEDVYVCSHFARDVGNNAEEKGLRCALVDIRYPDGGHSIVAFNTIDKGLVYFEPQFDDEVKVIINQSYSQLNNYLKPAGDDTIRDILVIW